MTFLALIISMLAFLVGTGWGQLTPDITDLDIERLVNLEVTSASRKSEQLRRTASAVYVITQEDIRRSGATSIPELLRMVPGVHVARIHASRWSISVRGLAERNHNILLVLMDGRTLYAPTFSRVYWDVQDTVLEDIERIEVIRGPGGTLWGANAVNGVVSIITKHSRHTQGTRVTANRNQSRSCLILMHISCFATEDNRLQRRISLKTKNNWVRSNACQQNPVTKSIEKGDLKTSNFVVPIGCSWE